MPWDKETARAAAAKSADASEVAMKDLIAAAKGEGDFAELEVAKRLDAIKAVLTYGIGRPPTSGQRATAQPDPEPEPGISLV
jgi:hypothetical protein